MYNSFHKMLPIMLIIITIVIVYSQASLIIKMHQLNQQLHKTKQAESDLRAERKRLMHERIELERKYHMYM